ncbi:hypothetical protein IPP75_03095 [Candidatus Saccharibacteria bacterium]|nr:MAG: hypothetical protein IPP75_03095 [Candidatus Saccharibacteria bacterium]
MPEKTNVAIVAGIIPNQKKAPDVARLFLAWGHGHFPYEQPVVEPQLVQT